MVAVTPPRVAPPKEVVGSSIEAPARRVDPRFRLHLLLNVPGSSTAALAVAVVLITTIFVAVVNFFLSTKPELATSDEVWAVEVGCGVIFSCELLLRCYVATLDLRTRLIDPALLLDFLSVIPFYVECAIRAQGLSTANTNHGGLLLLQFLSLLRLLRVFKLLKHYTDGRVLLIALSDSGRALLVPGFAMFMSILLLSGALIVVELATDFECRSDSNKTVAELEECESFPDGFEAMWAIFWVVTTLGFDGDYGTLHGPQRVIFAAAIMAGLIFTTMPITIIGEAFRAAWQRKELVEVQYKIQVPARVPVPAPVPVPVLARARDANANACASRGGSTSAD